MAERVRVSRATIARVLSEHPEILESLGVDVDDDQKNGAEALAATLSRLRVPSGPVAMVPIAPAIGHPVMSAMMPALGAHSPFATPVPDWVLEWIKAVVREELAGFQPGLTGEIWIKLPVRRGGVNKPMSGRTRTAAAGRPIGRKASRKISTRTPR